MVRGNQTKGKTKLILMTIMVVSGVVLGSCNRESYSAVFSADGISYRGSTVKCNKESGNTPSPFTCQYKDKQAKKMMRADF